MSNRQIIGLKGLLKGKNLQETIVLPSNSMMDTSFFPTHYDATPSARHSRTIRSALDPHVSALRRRHDLAGARYESWTSLLTCQSHDNWDFHGYEWIMNLDGF